MSSKRTESRYRSIQQPNKDAKISHKRVGKKQYITLNDAGDKFPELQKGDTEIWYIKDTEDGEKWFLKIGYEVKEEKDIASQLDIKTIMESLEKSHTLLGKIKEDSPDKIDKLYWILQGEVWSPNGEANSLIRDSNARHTSMMIGDIIVMHTKQNTKKVFILANEGWYDFEMD